MFKLIQSKAYRLIVPGQFVETTLTHELYDGEVVVEPTLASICHADLRYYTGQRRKDALERKLPMSLFHEGIGYVVESMDNEIKVGQKVVIVPNIPGYVMHHKDKMDCCEPCRRNAPDNYCKNGVFLGSGYDGIAQSKLVMPSKNVVPIPRNLPDEIALLAELCSVSFHALSHLDTKDLKFGKIAVFGDGPVGYLTAAMLHHIYQVPKERLLAFGAIQEKLQEFDFATQYLVHDFDFTKETGVTTAIECTGGRFSENAINQIITLLEPSSKLILMGVTEDRVPINTRDILEKGITLFGSSRSSVSDFESLLKAFQNQDYQKTLAKLLPESKIPIHNANDLQNAMNDASEHRGWKKTFLSFQWNNQ